MNRFYLAREQAALKRHFQFPPNVWDDFIDYRIDALLQQVARAEAELAALKKQAGP